MKWCDRHLQNPQNNRPGVKDNLSKQRSNLEQQMRLVNEQITMYRVSLVPLCVAEEVFVELLFIGITCPALPGADDIALWVVTGIACLPTALSCMSISTLRPNRC